MITTCGASNYAVGIFHLFNHAFFKALLFLSAGAIIHALANEQDIRKYGGLTQVLAFCYTMVLIGSLAIIGTPFLTGFYSKDLIIELASARYALSVHFSYLLATFSVFTTSYYSFRLMLQVFYSTLDTNQVATTRLTNLHRQNVPGAHDPDWVMGLPLIVLALGSIYAGFLFREMFVGLGTDFWNNAIFVNVGNTCLIEAEFLPQHIKLLPLGLTVAGGVVAVYTHLFYIKGSYTVATHKYFKTMYMFLNRRWLYDKLLNDFVAYPLFNSGFSLIRVFDKGLLELLPIAPLGMSQFFKRLYIQLGETQSGLIFHYAIIMILSMVCFFMMLTNPGNIIIQDSRVLAIMFVALATIG